ncbi:MAG: class I SAM-dependent methyltransferase [Acidobacteriota bacterium]
MLTDLQKELTGFYDRLFCAPEFGLDGRPSAGFGNLGYFTPATPDLNTACEQLMDVLMARITRRDGLILDVACGIGGSTKCLTKIFSPAAIHGINISARQIELCRTRVPEAHFHVMTAEKMEFPDRMFDVVISVEAAMHFKGRREFLLEAMRVLKPGGEIVVADMPFSSQPSAFTSVLGGQELYPTLDSYRSLWESCGVQDVEIEDVSGPVWRGFCAHVRNTAFRDLLAGVTNGGTFQERLHFAEKMNALPSLAYVIVKGRKGQRGASSHGDR